MPPHFRLPAALADPAFEDFATREPYFAVLTDPAYRADRLTPDAKARFFAGGAAVVDAIYKTAALRLDPHFAPTAVLEYGCGPGRLALPLARRSAERGGSVTAVDRSPAMLAHARANAAEAALGNVTFLSAAEALGRVRRDDGRGDRFDLVICYLVLQRLAPVEGRSLVGALLGLLLPGGVGVFQFPVASQVSSVTRALRRLRQSSPLVNHLAQRLRRDRTRGPFVPSHLYELNDMVELFRAAGLTSTHVVFDDHGDLASVLAFVVAPEIGRARAATDSVDLEPLPTTPGLELIDVREVIRTTPIEQLNEAAEAYFGTLTSWDHHLAKPFASADEAPALLTDLAVVLRALDLRPGLRVLEFGAGTGWLSRYLTQLGCSATVLDVSPTALRMAETLYDRLPVVGAQPAPSFLRFDGRRIDLPDASVDRIVCFHAFHHAPNPDDVIAEFARVLAPGGIAAFAEPGATHSRSAKSQFEMRSYRVVENDVDVHRIWEVASQHGFVDIRLLATNGDPLVLGLGDYDDLRRGGATLDLWARETRRYLRNVSNFALVKPGAEGRDSRSVEGLACVIHPARDTFGGRAGESIVLPVKVTNTGSARWLDPSAGPGGVSIGVRVFSETGTLESTHVSGRPLTDPPRFIGPGEGVHTVVAIPALPEGRYQVECDCVAEGVTWFAQAGSRPAKVTLVVTRAENG